MKGINNYVAAGNLTRDPDVKKTTTDNTMASFNLACNYRYFDKAKNDWVDGADFVPIVVYGAIAEACGKHLKKGSPVIIEGKVTTRSWEAQDGKRHYRTEVNAKTVTFLGSGSKDSENEEHFDQKRNGYQKEEDSGDVSFDPKDLESEKEKANGKPGQKKCPF